MTTQSDLPIQGTLEVDTRWYRDNKPVSEPIRILYFTCPGCGDVYKEYLSPYWDGFDYYPFGHHCLKCDTYVTQIYEPYVKFKTDTPLPAK